MKFSLPPCWSSLRSAILCALVVIAVPSLADCQVINQKVVKYLSTNLGSRVGGGEASDAVSEALRTSGGAFTSGDLGPDYPSDGDRMWGTPIKFVSYANDLFADSNPSTKVLPGDILQYSGAKFEYVSKKGRKTTTTTVNVNRHSAVVSKVNAKGFLPTEVYEQNGPSLTPGATSPREIAQNPLDLNALRAGSITVFRPKARTDEPGKYQISVINNTASDKLPVVKSGLNNVLSFSLSPTNTTSSYAALWTTAITPDKKFRLVLPNGAAMEIENATSYEIYNRASGVVSIRKLSP